MISLLECHSVFHYTFKTRLNRFYDTMLMSMAGKPMIDIFKFDDWLHEKHGNYEEERGMSMEELIVSEYGKEAMEAIKQLTGV